MDEAVKNGKFKFILKISKQKNKENQMLIRIVRFYYRKKNKFY